MQTEVLDQINNQKIRSGKIAELDEDSLLYKTSENEWNILECFLHMNLSMEIYLDQVEKKQDHFVAEKNPYRPTFLAGMFIRNMPPDKSGTIRMKMKTMRKLDPVLYQGKIDVNQIQRFLNNLERMEKILFKMKGKDTRSFKMNTALGPILKLYVGDALRFITAHNERHLSQIDRISQDITVINEGTNAP